PRRHQHDAPGEVLARLRMPAVDDRPGGRVHATPQGQRLVQANDTATGGPGEQGAPLASVSFGARGVRHAGPFLPRRTARTPPDCRTRPGPRRSLARSTPTSPSWS